MTSVDSQFVRMRVGEFVNGLVPDPEVSSQGAETIAVGSPVPVEVHVALGASLDDDPAPAIGVSVTQDLFLWPIVGHDHIWRILSSDIKPHSPFTGLRLLVLTVLLLWLCKSFVHRS
ncbi:hypothetical protein EGW08_014841 [Elysia chlorotica]|uniref:Uncharacterized protein n=1 Tax=Elysia chlorotica TaxID=188477 RepID=A0A433T704_ELYCH|nr:hypothetical protein EGW08_014841 [Elysia chlorotica]